VTSGTPLASNGVGAGASGESRRIAQDKLTRRVMKALDAIGTAIGRILESALLAESGIVATVSVEWESPEPVSERDALETALMKLSLGVSRHTLLKELGYDPERESAYRADERAEVRDERMDQQQFAAPETRARLGRELGARYLLQGDVQAIEDAERRERVVFYQVDATLIDLETNAKVWAGQHKIKKYIQKRRITG
jgi:hypothetical protein